MLRNLFIRIFGDLALIINRGEEFAKNRLHILWFSVLSNVIFVLCGGIFFTGMLLRIGGSDVYIGGVTAAASLCAVAAVFSPIFLKRRARRKPILIILRCAYYLLFLGLVTALPYISMDQGARLALLLVAVAAANFLSSLSGGGLSNWHGQSMPQNVRSTFYTNLSMIMGVLNMILLSLAGLFADYFKSVGKELFGIELLRLAACLLAVIEIIALSRIREYPYPQTEQSKPFEQLKIQFKNSRYRSAMALVLLWTIAASIPGPFYLIYLIKDLKIGYSFLSMVNLLNIPVLLIAAPIWGRIVSRYGDVKLFPVLSLLAVLHFLSLSFVTAGNYQWLYPASVFYYFLIAAGIAHAASTLPFKYLPDPGQASFLTLYGLISSVGFLFGSGVGLLFISVTQHSTLALAGFQLGNKQLLMAAAAVFLMICSAGMLLLRRSLERMDQREVDRNAVENL